MTVTHSVVFPRGYPLILRKWFTAFGAFSITAPPQATWVRVSLSPAGGFKDDAPGWGGGGAFAFNAETSVAGTYTGQVGDSDHARTAQNDGLGDSWLKRPDGTLLGYADRGRPDGTPGLAANCTGYITRGGAAATASQGGASAGDDADPLALGFGGAGASSALAAYYGAGGGYELGHDFPTFPAGDGAVCVEFFSVNPNPGGYDTPPTTGGAEANFAGPTTSGLLVVLFSDI
jgi:hypothetical protein